MAKATLRQSLPPDLVEAILDHMTETGTIRRADNFLEWKKDSGVGNDCMKLANKTTAFIKRLGDRDVIDTSGIWKAVAHQCHIYAYS